VEVLERANQRIVGRYHMEHGLSFVIPSNTRINQDIAIPPEHRGGATLSQIVEVEIIEQPNPRSQPIGRITAVLGDHMAPGMEIDIAIRSHDLPYEWPDAVEREITVKIAGATVDTFTLQGNTGKVVKYALDGGPVEISGPSGSKIIASLNQWRKRVGTTEWTGVSQSMALPVGNLSNVYVMPRYDYSVPLQLYNTILVANLDGVARNVTITIGGTAVNETFSLGASESVYKTYSGVAGGPVVVSSDTGAKIIASLYELRRDPNQAGWNGQSEMMGLPWEQLSDQYVLPIYFGVASAATLDARLFVGVP
jgi:hypothetical protein